MQHRWFALGFILALTPACLDKDGGDDTGLDDNYGWVDPGPDSVDDGCADIFAQNVMPKYDVEISDADLDLLEQEFREADVVEPHMFYPITFTYEGEEVPATIRLKGNTSWVQAIEFDEDPKMQFVISFNETDPAGRWKGLRKIELDMPRSDYSFLRQRLGLYYLRSIGQPAQCANSARLHINGEYYGLYTNLERLDKEFLERHFPNDDQGDLWKGGRILKTNDEANPDYSRLDPFWDDEVPLDINSLDALVDLEGSVAAWTAEAMMPHSDGYYMGRPNFFLYDHPTRGFLWISADLDSAFDYLLPDIDPMYGNCDEVEAYKCGGRGNNERQHFRIVIGDPSWNQTYVDDLATARAGYDAEHLSAMTDLWSRQIRGGVLADPHKPFTDGDHDFWVASLEAYPAMRAAAVDEWLACRTEGGEDADGDGFSNCEECNDADAAVNPGATEICGNLVDDDCDFLIDVAPACPED